MKNIKNKTLITNNPYVYEKYKDRIEIIFDIDYKYMEVLELTRDKIHTGHKLLTHPLSGSIKPNETPYKTVLITMDKSSLDFDSLNTIEKSIETTRKFLLNENTPNWTEKVLEDFKTIDLSLIDNVINNFI